MRFTRSQIYMYNVSLTIVKDMIFTCRERTRGSGGSAAARLITTPQRVAPAPAAAAVRRLD